MTVLRLAGLRVRRWRRSLFITLLTVSVAALHAATGSAASATLAVLGVDVSAYPSVFVTVAPRLPPALGASGALPVSAFRLTEDGAPRDVDVDRVTTQDLEVVLLLDTSDAGEGKRFRTVLNAAVEFVLRVPAARVGVVEYGGDPRVVVPPTADPAAVTAALGTLRPTDETALHDAVALALDQFPPEGQGREVVVAVSTSADTASATSLEEAAALVAGSGATFYGLDVRSGGDTTALNRLAAASGTQPLIAPEPSDLVGLFDVVAADLLNSYRLSYRSEARGAPTPVTVVIDHDGTIAEATVTIRPRDAAGRSSQPTSPRVDMSSGEPRPTLTQAPGTAGPQAGPAVSDPRGSPGESASDLPVLALPAALASALLLLGLVALRRRWTAAGAPPELKDLAAHFAPIPRALASLRLYRLPTSPARPRTSTAAVGRPIRGRPDRGAQVVLLAVRLAVVAVVFGQRFALPVGSARVPAVLVAVYGVLIALVVCEALRHDRVRFELFTIGMAACCLSTLWASFRGEIFSVASLLYLLMSYLPWIFCVRARFAWLYPVVVRFFLDAMVVVALLTVVQMGVQFLGLPFLDPVTSLPDAFLVEEFNTTYPIVYGSPILKSNGMVMLEPSFLSQFFALAAVAAFLTRTSVWRVGLYCAGLLASVSGTGIVLALVGVVALVVRAREGLRPALVWPAVALVAVLLATPLGAVLAERRSELGQGGSSATLRFLTPYQEVAGGLEADPPRYLLGAGPGASDRTLESGRGRAGLAVVYPSIPKLVYEYGIVSGLLFAAFMGVCLFWRVRLPVIPTCCFLMLFVLSGSLLQPHTVFLVWILTSLFGRSDAEATAPVGAPRVALDPTPRTAVGQGRP